MKAAAKLLSTKMDFLIFLPCHLPDVPGRKEWDCEQLQRCVTQPVVWLLTCCCPSRAKGTAAAAWWQSPRLPVSEKDFLSLPDLHKIALLRFPTTRHPTVTGYFPHSNRVFPTVAASLAPAGLSGCACIPLPLPVWAQPCSSRAGSHCLLSPSLPHGPLGRAWGSPTALTQPKCS